MKARMFVILAILCFCPADLLSDDEFMDRMLRSSVLKSNLTLMSTHITRFHPQGLSGVAILGESHAAIHSWPENGQLFIDIASCSSKESAYSVFKLIVDHFRSADCYLSRTDCSA